MFEHDCLISGNIFRLNLFIFSTFYLFNETKTVFSEQSFHRTQF